MRKVGKLKLRKLYEQGGDFASLVRRLKSLVYVPIPRVGEGYELVTAQANFAAGTKERKFIDYFETVMVS